ncbi:hypothetical protein [Bradyrhizobium sp. Ash2021]|jgi:hypothetical protein|nr:hypothetical protein [Bradyrhizobium sp. Ash2021]
MSGRRSEQDLSLIQIMIRVAIACALTAMIAIGAFLVILFVAGTG